MIRDLLIPIIVKPEGEEMGEAVVVSPIALIARSAKLKGAHPDPFWTKILDKAIEVLDCNDLQGTDFLTPEDKKMIIKRYPTAAISCQLSGYPNVLNVLKHAYRRAVVEHGSGDKTGRKSADMDSLFESDEEALFQLAADLLSSDNPHKTIVENRLHTTHILRQFNTQSPWVDYLDGEREAQEKMVHRYKANPFSTVRESRYSETSIGVQAFINLLLKETKSSGSYSKRVPEAFFDLMAREPGLLNDYDLMGRFSKVMCDCRKEDIVSAFVESSDIQAFLLGQADPRKEGASLGPQLLALKVRGGRLSSLLQSSKNVTQLQQDYSVDALKGMRQLIVNILCNKGVNTHNHSDKDESSSLTSEALFNLIKERPTLESGGAGKAMLAFLVEGLSDAEREQLNSRLEQRNNGNKRVELSELVTKIESAVKRDQALPVTWNSHPDLKTEAINLGPLIDRIKDGRPVSAESKRTLYALINHQPDTIMQRFDGERLVEIINRHVRGKRGAAMRESINSTFKRSFDFSEKQLSVLESVLVIACNHQDWNSFLLLAPLLSGADKGDVSFDKNPVLNVMRVAQKRLDLIDAKRADATEKEMERVVVLTPVNKALKALFAVDRECWGLLPSTQEEQLASILNDENLWRDPSCEPLRAVGRCIGEQVLEQISGQVLTKLYNDIFMGVDVKNSVDLAQSALDRYDGVVSLLQIDTEAVARRAESKFELEPFLKYVTLKREQGSPINVQKALSNSVALASRGSTVLSKLVNSACKEGYVDFALAMFKNACDRGDMESIVLLCNDSEFVQSAKGRLSHFNPIKRALISLHGQVANQVRTLDQAKAMADRVLYECTNQEVLTSFYLDENPAAQVGELEKIAKEFYEPLMDVQREGGFFVS